MGSLPQPGSPDYVPSLIRHLGEEPSLAGWQPDPGLFAALLLTLIVNKGGMVVDVPSSEGKISRVVEHVCAMTRSIFGLRTHIMRLEPGTSPEEVTHQFMDKPRKDVVVKPSHPARQASAASARRGVTIPGTPSRPRLRIDTSSSTKMLPGPEAVSVGYYDGNSTNRSTAIREKDEEEERIETSDGDPLADVGAGSQSVIPEVLVVTGLESANSPAMIKLVDILVQRKLDAEKEGTVPLTDNFTVIWIRDERGPDVPGWVVDQFVTSTLTWPADLKSPPRGLSTQPIISQKYVSQLNGLLPYTHIHPPLSIHISNLLSATTSHARLHATITGKVMRFVPDFVRAHRLLSAPFDLPSNWETALDRAQGLGGLDYLQDRDGQSVGTGPEDKFGVGGGIGGVNTWATKAGEEPSINELVAKMLYPEVDIATLGKDKQTHVEEWYCGFSNVEGVWMTLMRHRVRGRKERGGIMWLLDDSATGVKDDKGPKKLDNQKETQKRRIAAEHILGEILRTV